MWIDHLSNGQAARSAFGKHIPELQGLRLEQVVIGPAHDLAIALNLGQLPETVPAKWREKGCDQLQLRMRFATRDLTIRHDALKTDPDKVSVEIEECRLRIVSDNGSFELTASFIDALLELYPYRSAEYEFPPEWYNPF